MRGDLGRVYLICLHLFREIITVYSRVDLSVFCRQAVPHVGLGQVLRSAPAEGRHQAETEPRTRVSLL